MILGRNKEDYLVYAERIAKHVASQEAVEAILAITETMFDMPAPKKADRPAKADEHRLAKIIVKVSSGKSGSAEVVCKATKANPDSKAQTSQRTLWRYFVNMPLHQFQKELRRVWHLLFHLARRRFGLMRHGYEVYIDEHQTLFFGKARKYLKDRNGEEIWVVDESDADLTEVGTLAGVSKEDKYSGKFRALTYQVMAACLLPARVMLPLDIVLVSKGGSLMIDDLRVPELSREWIINHFIGILEANYPPPNLILFDRGYHANANYARVYEYCRRYGSLYMTPAVRDAGEILDAQGKVHAGLDAFMDANRRHAKPIHPGGEILCLVAKRPATRGLTSPVPRTLLVFYRRHHKDDDLPQGALVLNDGYWGFGFYTNEPDPEKRIAWWERAYSRRWREENGFKARVDNFHNGRNHKALRRFAVFAIGFVIMAIHALIRGILYPEYDVVATSRHFSLPGFVEALLERLKPS